jgi:hypothetical protein
MVIYWALFAAVALVNFSLVAVWICGMSGEIKSSPLIYYNATITFTLLMWNVLTVVLVEESI